MASFLTRHRDLLFLCVALGAFLYSVFNALGVSSGFSSSGSAVAFVNGTAIPTAEYARAVKAMQAGIERELTNKDLARALDMLINEELIVQEAVHLGLATEDRLVRKNLVQAMMRSATSLDTGDVSVSELEEFYDQNKPLFAAPKLYSVEAMRIIGGTSFDTFKSNLDDNMSFQDAAMKAGFELVDVPKNIPIGKVGDFMGGSVGDVVSKMTVGDIGGPIRSGNSKIVVWLMNVEGGVSSFEEARALVETEFMRRGEEDALEAYVERLRKRARINKVKSK